MINISVKRSAAMMLPMFTLAAGLAAGLGSVPSSDGGEKKPSPLALKLEHVSAPLLPFQAVRLRATLRNDGKKRIGPLEVIYPWTHVNGPGDAAYTELEMLPDKANAALMPSAVSVMIQKAPVHLDPGEELSVSYSLAAKLSEPKRPAVPAFAEPGVYTLKWVCQVGGESHEQTIEVVVREPDDKDKVLVQWLTKDRALAMCLLDFVNAPGDSQMAKLKDIAYRFPNSTYATYARFALARGYQAGKGFSPFSRRVADAMAADQLDKVVERRSEIKDGARSPQPGFAFLPDALMLFSTVERVAKEDVARRLDREFPDALVVLEHVASSLGTDPALAESIVTRKCPDDPGAARSFLFDAWRAYRKRAAKDPHVDSRIP